jgi:hypothetical protein
MAGKIPRAVIPRAAGVGFCNFFPGGGSMPANSPMKFCSGDFAAKKIRQPKL